MEVDGGVMSTEVGLSLLGESFRGSQPKGKLQLLLHVSKTEA